MIARLIRALFRRKTCAEDGCGYEVPRPFDPIWDRSGEKCASCGHWI